MLMVTKRVQVQKAYEKLQILKLHNYPLIFTWHIDKLYPHFWKIYGH